MNGRTVLTYIKELEEYGKIRREDGFIVWAGDEVSKERLDDTFRDFNNRLGQIEGD